ncbi:MAG: DUF1295 domain-containing protein [Gemmatimonadota bacterium]|nr:DUF1295 domain-containing protein [Gemmatimonadota bacterium]
MTPLAAVVAVAVAMSAVMLGLWLFALRRHEADAVDLGWTAGLGAAALFYAIALDGGVTGRRWLVAAMAGLWSGRLALYLWRRVLAEGEDGRYRELRRKWGDRARTRFFLFFQAQGLLVALLSLHFMIAMLARSEPVGWLDALGALILLTSVVGESIADRQLERWRNDPSKQGRVCKEGLWRYSRHPNYFFEWFHWLAYIPLTIGTAWLPAMFVAPTILLLLIVFVTGIPPTEAQSLRSRGEAYREYQRTTSAFFPWFPKEDAA